MMKKCQKINLQKPQRKRNANVNFVNLIRTSTVHCILFLSCFVLCCSDGCLLCMSCLLDVHVLFTFILSSAFGIIIVTSSAVRYLTEKQTVSCQIS